VTPRSNERNLPLRLEQEQDTFYTPRTSRRLRFVKQEPKEPEFIIPVNPGGTAGNNGNGSSTEYDWNSADDNALLASMEKDAPEDSPFVTPKKRKVTTMLAAPGGLVTPATTTTTSRAAGRTPGTGGTEFMSAYDMQKSRDGQRDGSPTPAGRKRPECELVGEVMRVISEDGIKMGEGGKAKIRRVCEVWEGRSRGVLRGRDVLRKSIGEKDERIAELQRLVGRLQEELETEKEIVKLLRQLK